MKSDDVNYSLVLYDYPADEIVPLARAAEASGFEGIWAGEHYVCPKTFTSEHPSANPEDRHPAARIVGAQTRLHEPWSLLGAIAGATTRLNVGTAICIVPLNQPLVLARSALTLQEISGGRFRLGTGVGWLEEEFRALNIPFKSRGDRYDEILDILRQVWAGGYSEYRGNHFEFDAVQLTPHAVDVPLIIGGNSERALKRVAQKADGWINSAMIALEDAVHLRDRIEELRREFGTDHRPFSYYVRPSEISPEVIEQFVREGFTNLVLWGPQVWPNTNDMTVEAKVARMQQVALDLGIGESRTGPQEPTN